MNSIQISLIQHDCTSSIEQNLDFLLDKIRQSAEAGNKLICLQELHNSLYFCQEENATNFDLAETIPGPTTDAFSLIAKTHQIVIVASLFEKRASGLFHNTAVVFDSDGSIAGTYRKMHIPDDPGYYEKFYFTPGDLGFSPIQTSVGRLGVLICWDQWFPEAARLMTLAGAELLIYPTAIGWDRRDDKEEQQRQLNAWQTVQRGHAIANGIPVIACNRVGFEAHPTNTNDGIEFWGNSFICGPQGELLAQADETAQTLNSTIDLKRVEAVRRIWPYLRDRRIDAYDDIVKRYLDTKLD